SRCPSYGEEKEYAAVYREGRHISAIWNHAEREDRYRGEDDRREKMHDLIRTRGHDVFLDQHFDAVSDWLEKTEWTDAVWPIAVLHPPENFPFQHRNERKEREKHRKHRNNVDEAGRDLDQPIWRTGNQEKQPSLQMNKDLVKRRTHLSARKAIATDLIKSESQVRRCESGVELLISKRAARAKRFNDLTVTRQRHEFPADFSIRYFQPGNSWRRAAIRPGHAAGIEKQNTTASFIERNVRMGVQENIYIIRRMSGWNVLQTEFQSSSQTRNDRRRRKMGTAISAHDEHAR